MEDSNLKIRSSSMSPSPVKRVSSSSPSNSPNRLRSLVSQGFINEDSELYQSAMGKIYEASWKFDRGKNGELLKTLDNRELTTDQFRQIMKSGMNCKLTNDEFNSVFPLFNNHGMVDGCEFILLFYRLRYEYRSTLLTKRIKKERRHKEMVKALEIKKAEYIESKKLIELTDFSADDLKIANEKITNAAVKYDRLMPGSVQLDAFDAETMNPGEFKEQMKLVFNIQLSIPELSAFINYFNNTVRSDEQQSDVSNKKTINCAAFLVYFFRLGFKEKTKRLRVAWAEKKRILTEREERKKEEEKELAEKNALKVNFKFTEDDKANAIIKLRNAAKLYDKTTPGAMSMKAFEVKEMPPHIFKEQLKRIFNLNVTPAEMGALMAVFDVNGDGVITCEEFTKVFINMGFEEREKELKANMEKQKMYELRKQKEKEAKEAEKASLNALKISYEFTEDEYNSAMQKLTEAAWKYDKNMPGAPSLEAFEAKTMDAHTLQEQLKRAFMMKITPQELGVIMNYFDPEKLGYINCSDFLKKFFRIGYNERQHRRQQWREYQEVLNNQKARKQAEKQHQLTLKTNSVIAASTEEKEYSEKDFQSAINKLTIGATKYDKALPGAASLHAFECLSMPAHVFKEQLKMILNVKVNIPELWSLVDYFSPASGVSQQSAVFGSSTISDRPLSPSSGSKAQLIPPGEIDCKRFLAEFLRTGYLERIRIKEQWKKKQKEIENERKLQELRDIEEKDQLAYTKDIDFDYLESDFDSILEKFIKLSGYFIDARSLGPAGLNAFQAESLNPAEFREMLKRTFNFYKYTPRELGALVSYFDIHSQKRVHCSTFLNSITQIRVQCEEFKGKQEEKERLQQLHSQLKDAYKTRVARNPSVDAKPWRQNGALAKSVIAKRVFKPKDLKFPEDPMAKYRLRLLIGRRTGRMDLSCQALWPNKPPSASNSVPGSPQVSPKAKKQVDNPQVDSNGPESAFFLTENKDEENLAQEVEELNIDEENEQIFADMISLENSTDEQLTNSIEPPIPTSLSNQKSIEFRLHIIPSEIFRIKELRELWLCNHTISVIPKEIVNLDQLQVLSLANNRLESLPPAICELPNLHRLFLQGNQLTTLPNLFGKLITLQELNLSRNNYIEFPEVLTTVPSLISLNMSSNQLSKLSKNLTKMKALTLLNLENNKFTGPSSIFLKTPWIEVKGCTLPVGEKASKSFVITPSEEYELLGLLKSRSANRLANKLRRRKKKSAYDL